MRRLPVFALLGPLSCWLLVVAGAWIVFGVGPLDEGWQMFVAMLFGTFGVVLPFMLALAWVDGRLSRFRWRIPAVALVAFGVSVAVFFELTRESWSAENWGYFRQYWWMMGLVLALPAALCSWVGGLYATDGPR